MVYHPLYLCSEKTAFKTATRFDNGTRKKNGESTYKMTEEASVPLKLKGRSCIITFRFIRGHILDVMRNEWVRTTTDMNPETAVENLRRTVTNWLIVFEARF